eukprot:TRINITY_DN109016_c0_g1_i1.p1 TRINITY_DN109016_c0_g1~~TRINITY_DN109016_c0_g1_i1.p1  ORF type:complete len:619 (-),score=96.44 TRINITY_DN109016_c0_g1_i1:19-1806(-)
MEHGFCGSGAAYEYGLRTPSPRRASAASTPDPRLAPWEEVRQLFPPLELQELPRMPSGTGSSAVPSAAAAPPVTPRQVRPRDRQLEQLLEEDVDQRPPLRSLHRCEYSDRLIPSRAGSNLETGLGLLASEQAPSGALPRSPESSHRPTSVHSSPGVAGDRWRRDENGAAAFDRLLRSELLCPRSPQPARAAAGDRSEEEQLLRTPERGNGLFRYKCQSEDGPLSNPLSPSPLRTGSTCYETPRRVPRKIPQEPYKVLSAPGLEDDYYLNLLDFSAEDVLAVGLGSCVDLWATRSGRSSRLCNMANHNGVASVRWARHRDVLHRSAEMLAVGTLDGQVHLWDVTTCQKLRSLKAHSRRTCALAWADSGTIFTGAQDRDILRWDIREPCDGRGKGPAQRLRGHPQEVTGLTWSPEWQQLASGGNEGQVNVWSGRSSAPDVRLGEHTAAVKALSWSPTLRGVLATGGGTADKSVRLWSALTGMQTSQFQTDSQVTNMMWSPAGDGELLTTHGYSTNELAIWRHVSGGGLIRLHQVKWHKARVLYLAVSADGQTVVTGAGNEVLCFWNLLAPCKARVSTPGSATSLSISEVSTLSRTIR